MVRKRAQQHTVPKLAGTEERGAEGRCHRHGNWVSQRKWGRNPVGQSGSGLESGE